MLNCFKFLPTLNCLYIAGEPSSIFIKIATIPIGIASIINAINEIKISINLLNPK